MFSDKYITAEPENCYFEQISDKMIVSDPSYEYNEKEHTKNSKLMKLNLVIDNVKKGQWVFILIIRKDELEKNAEIIAFNLSSKNKSENKKIDLLHEINSRKLFENGWEKVGTIAVDSGMAGIYDLAHYGDDNVAINSTSNPRFDRAKDKWLEMNINIANEPTDYSSSIPFGMVASSGYGDGMYSVYVMKNKSDQVVAIKIIFIDDKEKEKWQELKTRSNKNKSRKSYNESDKNELDSNRSDDEDNGSNNDLFSLIMKHMANKK